MKRAVHTINMEATIHIETSELNASLIERRIIDAIGDIEESCEKMEASTDTSVFTTILDVEDE